MGRDCAASWNLLVPPRRRREGGRRQTGHGADGIRRGRRGEPAMKAHEMFARVLKKKRRRSSKEDAPGCGSSEEHRGAITVFGHVVDPHAGMRESLLRACTGKTLASSSSLWPVLKRLPRGAHRLWSAVPAHGRIAYSTIATTPDGRRAAPGRIALHAGECHHPARGPRTARRAHTTK